MKNCPHDASRWIVTTVADYERQHGDQPWMEDRIPSDLVSARCPQCDRELVLGPADEGIETRAAEIASCLDPWLDGFVPIWGFGDGSMVSWSEYRGLVGYLCPLTFDPGIDAEVAGWLAHHIDDALQGHGPMVKPETAFVEADDQERAERIGYPILRDEVTALAYQLADRDGDVAAADARIAQLEGDLDAVQAELEAVRASLEEAPNEALVAVMGGILDEAVDEVAAEVRGECPPVYEAVDPATVPR